MNAAAPFSMQLSVPSIVDALKDDGYFILFTSLKDEVEIRNFQLNLSAKLGCLREHNPGRQDYVWPICPKPSDSALATFSDWILRRSGIPSGSLKSITKLCNSHTR